MDFDVSKENIQPLRGGRNVTQLGMALQAQSNPDLQLELLQQKEEFEQAIKNYQGADPLDNYYHYISWIEQSYPKHGHEGNFVALLEHCLAKFENEKKYWEDRRFIKLWIKYIDLQQNPIELFQMMYSRGIGTGCADLYKAWAYYHEAAGDFQSASTVFEYGKKALAQPFEELETAYNNLVMSAGQHLLFGSDERKLAEKRLALTSLVTYKPGRVASIRVPAGTGAGTLPSAVGPSRTNASLFVYEDQETASGTTMYPPDSIITAARRKDAPKENTLKPGPWTTVPVKKRVIAQKFGASSGFTVHEDSNEETEVKYLNLSTLPKHSLENYSDWCVNIKVAEPYDPRMVPRYPKDLVYIDPHTEYSIEELRARRYKRTGKGTSLASNSIMEVSTVLGSRGNSQHEQASSSMIMRSLLQTSASQKATLPVFEDPIICLDSPEPATGDTQWMSPAMCPPRPPESNFAVFEESSHDIRPQVSQPKGTAMKTPFKVLTADDLAETGSRGGMDVAATAQAADSAQAMPHCLDDKMDGFCHNVNLNDLNVTCNTQMFNINLLHVSTPDTKKQTGFTVAGEGLESTKKQLFQQPQEVQEKGLSTIIEETRSGFGSSSTSNGGISKTSPFEHNRPAAMTTISEEHNSYLAQNLMANAALRSSLLGEFMDFPTQPLVEPMQSSPIEPYSRQFPTPITAKPLEVAPSNPFAAKVLNLLLERVRFPGPHTQGLYYLNNIPKLVVKKDPIMIGNERYIVEKQLGKGTYGTVFKALSLQSNKSVALKYQRPPNKWEYYICREIQARIDDSLRRHFMDISIAYFSDVGSIFISDFMPCGSLLDVANTYKQRAGKKMPESLVTYFSIKMLEAVQALHQIKIIHADIKPDNFLVQVVGNRPELHLIDFGCSIDMSLFPPNTSFTRKITTEDFICPEMLEGRPWNYHTDLFCVAASTHVLLFDKYIQMQNNEGHWSITSRFARYARVDLWNSYFSTLLNQQNGPADVDELLRMLGDTKIDNTDMNYLVNLLRNR